MATLLLLDGNSLTYRAFFALPPDLTTASGQVTNAVFGFTSMLINLLRDQKPDAVAVCFDRPEPTFRHVANPEYKAQRQAAPDVLRQQMGLVRQVVESLGITSFEAPGWEADDLIATLATQATERGDRTVIVTGDRDSFQLVEDPAVAVLYNVRGVSEYSLYDEAGIEGKTGVPPRLYREYASLRGDPSDNLPGVPGVGEKTAAKLVTTYGSLDGIFAHLDEQTPKLKASLAEHEVRVRANAEVMVLRTDAPVSATPEELGWGPPDRAELDRLFDFLEFRTLRERLMDVLAARDGTVVGPANSGTVLEAEVRGFESPADAVAALAALAADAPVGVAPAWSGAPARSELLGVAVVLDAEAADVGWLPAGLLRHPEVAAALGGHPWLAHDAKPLLRGLHALGLATTRLRLDTAIAAYLLDPAEARYQLGELLTRITGNVLPSGGPPEGQLDLGGAAAPAELEAGRSALAVHHLAPALEAALERDGMATLYREIENPLVRVLARMEDAGVGVDEVELRRLRDQLTSECDRLVGLVYEAAGRVFNLNSTPQLRALLFDERGLAPQKKTKTGYSTDAASLEKLKDQWPELIEPLLEYREVEKLRSTYGEGLLAEVASDGRIHATFNQTVARTGRLSSDQPNLHNIPVRSEVGRQFRKAFVPRPGWQLLVADYNQIELRCIAHLAEDPGLVEAFESGRDIHTTTAARVFSVEPSAVTIEQRAKAKMVSYGLAYGMEAFGLAQRLNIPTSEAAVILDAYFEAFPRVREYMDRTVNEARKRGYTETLFGRRRPIPELLSSNIRLRQAGERQAMNAGIQGLAADLFKVALVRLDGALESGGHASTLVLQVHDEVLVELAPGEEDAVRPLVRDTLSGAADLRVPLAVNLAVGPSWADAKP